MVAAIEGGVQREEGGAATSNSLSCIAAVVVLGRGGYESRAWAAAFPLPPRVAELVLAGRSLGEADDLVLGPHHQNFASPGLAARGGGEGAHGEGEQDRRRRQQGAMSGTVGKLTGGLVSRAAYYEQAVLLALVPFLNPHVYEGAEL